jgi:hypothetical protein
LTDRSPTRKVNVVDADSDNDGLFDGTESGKDCSNAATNVGAGTCIADADPSTKTNPLDPDTDKGGVKDGIEDKNHNGSVDPGERDPLNKADDNTSPVDPDQDAKLEGGGFACSSSSGSSEGGAMTGLGIMIGLSLVRRKKRAA